ncbi:DNA alkylation repair protein [Candidatus Saccharibacteria bacterium RIFCSPLOWO2_01_FULL_48_13]|nr:MAG: DNA alkylation repair protein [Candidatus Saccharibacteria bacterium RIFCSPLOWO2_01_FULL_48_13]
MTSQDVILALKERASAERAATSARFFKTDKGQYGEGDKFIGVNMPDTRAVCKKYKDLPKLEVQKLLDSKVHEHRMAGAIILTYQFAKADAAEREKIYQLYMKNVYAGRINNWDLVDVTTPRIVGAYLIDKPRDVLTMLAKSQNLWQRRVAILATFAFINRGESADAIAIAKILLHDKHDLIHKAVGWMLREMGKRVDEKTLTSFLDTHAQQMPRTMLRYSIERLSSKQKSHYMNIKPNKVTMVVE